MLRRRYQLLFLAAVALAVYYPAVFADFSIIDDRGMYEALAGREGWGLGSVFTPSGTEGLYYRPLLILSFVADKQLLGLAPGMMHLENILFHLANAILVFFLVFHVLPPSKRNNSLLPLFAALFFGLHPINAESVNWISGRTDLLAGMFVLLSAFLLLLFKEYSSKKYLILSLLAFLGGALSKESAIAFLPGALFLITANVQGGVPARNENSFMRSKYQHHAMLVLGGVLVLGLFYALRSAAFVSYSHRVGITRMVVSDDWGHSLFVTLRTFGFYMKKFFIPLPLNFVIKDVDPLYEILAVPATAFCIYTAARNTLVSALFTAGIFLLAPALIISFGQIAWTPYAERYLYISSAFMIVSLVSLAGEHVKNFRFAPHVALVILTLMFASTLHRSVIWSSDLTLCKDTVAKSPQAREIRAIYAQLLAQKGEYAAALEQLQIGKALPSLFYDSRFDICLGYIYYKQGRVDEAIRTTETVAEKTKGTSVLAIQNLIIYLAHKEEYVKQQAEKQNLQGKIIEYELKLFELTHDPHILYSIADDEIARGQRKTALVYYKRAESSLPENDPWKSVARKKIFQLAQSKSEI